MSTPAIEGVEIVIDGLDPDPDAVEALASTLTMTERERAARFVFDRDRRRFMVARGKLRQLLGTRLGMKPESVEITYGVNGKPALAPGRASVDLRFNVSHSNDVAVFAFAFGREVGIDVEAIHSIQDPDAIAGRYFSITENSAYSGLDPKDKLPGFFNCWTRKEAFVKALGEGLGYPLDRFDVSLAPGEPARILRFQGKPGNACGWHLDAFCPVPGYVGAVVIKEG